MQSLCFSKMELSFLLFITLFRCFNSFEELTPSDGGSDDYTNNTSTNTTTESYNTNSTSTEGIGSYEDIPAYDESQNLQEFMDNLLANKTINLTHKPPTAVATGNETTFPVKVSIDLLVTNIGSISALDMAYTLSLVLRQSWNDPRLRFTNYNDNVLMNSKRDKLWVPELHFSNAVNSADSLLKSNNFLLWVNSSGDVLYSQKLTVRLICVMKLYSFPLDDQLCPLQISPYSYLRKEVELLWISTNKLENIEIENPELNDFHVNVERTHYDDKLYRRLGYFSTIGAVFKLSRKFGFYMIHTYMPSVFIVFISWLSFFIDFKSTPARISLNLLSVLSLITQSASTLQKLPRISYIKAIDVWLFSCLAFVVLSLMEFATINSVCREDPKTMTEVLQTVATGDENNDGIPKPRILQVARMKNWMAKTSSGYFIDKVFIFIYPIMFVCFNLFYWSIYSHFKDHLKIPFINNIITTN